MGATAEQIARLRGMIAEPTTTPYSDEALAARIEDTPKHDQDGVLPDEEGWVETYDLNRTASQIWTEKAAALAGAYDVNADGASYSRNQKYANAVKLAGLFASRAAPRIRQLERRGAINVFNVNGETAESQT
jgi:hypothetical protein